MIRQERCLRIIIIGFGVVGQNVAELLSLYLGELRQLCNADFKIVAIVDSKGAAVSPEKGINLTEALQVKKQTRSVSALNNAGRLRYSALEVLDEISGDIVIETTPTNIENGEPGLTHIRTSLSQGRHVITTNKGPLALELPALMELAGRNNVRLLFSGSVGGGMPILNLVQSLHAEKILSVRGVLNATTNYILWRMDKGHVKFDEALREAHEFGYTEANSRYDIDGIDTACKLVILSNVAMNIKAKLADVKIKGIREITLQDITEANRDNCTFRLVGSTDKGLSVFPERISKDDSICVDSASNALTVTSTFSGAHTLIGKGAGGRETAGSVIRDIVHLVQKIGLNNDPLGCNSQ